MRGAACCPACLPPGTRAASWPRSRIASTCLRHHHCCCRRQHALNPRPLPVVVNIDKPSTQVRYAVEDREPPLLREEVASFVERCCKGGRGGRGEGAA